jgi:hypothetical protein
MFFQSEDKSYENTGAIFKAIGLQACLNARSTSLTGDKKKHKYCAPDDPLLAYTYDGKID